MTKGHHAGVGSDVLARLKSQGKVYQTRMNAILRRAMLAEIGRTSSTDRK